MNCTHPFFEDFYNFRTAYARFPWTSIIQGPHTRGLKLCDLMIEKQPLYLPQVIQLLSPHLGSPELRKHIFPFGSSERHLLEVQIVD